MRYVAFQVGNKGNFSTTTAVSSAGRPNYNVDEDAQLGHFASILGLVTNPETAKVTNRKVNGKAHDAKQLNQQKIPTQ